MTNVRHLLFSEKVYNSYEEAALSCGKALYEEQAIVERIRLTRKSTEIGRGGMSLPNIGVLPILDAVHRVYTRDHPKEIAVLDFGGADGNYFRYVSKLIAPGISLRWSVVETPAMVRAMREFEGSGLRFFTSVSEALQNTAQKIDLVFTSGAIQYTSDPWQTLHRLLDIRASYMIFNRQSLSMEDFDIVSIQTSLLSWHGEGPVPAGTKDTIVRYPHTSMQRLRFEEAVSGRYRTLYTFPETSGVKKVNKLRIAGISYFLENTGFGS